MYLVSILFLNWAGMMVTAELTAVHRTIFEAVRTFMIWLVDVFIYYVVSHNYGEGLNYWSLLEATGE